jgi:hypothetical protein
MKAGPAIDPKVIEKGEQLLAVKIHEIGKRCKVNVLIERHDTWDSRIKKQIEKNGILRHTEKSKANFITEGDISRRQKTSDYKLQSSKTWTVPRK